MDDIDERDLHRAVKVLEKHRMLSVEKLGQLAGLGNTQLCCTVLSEHKLIKYRQKVSKGLVQ